MIYFVPVDSAAANVDVVADADVVGIANAGSVRGLTTVMWCCWCYSDAVVIVWL